MKVQPNYFDLNTTQLMQSYRVIVSREMRLISLKMCLISWIGMNELAQAK